MKWVFSILALAVVVSYFGFAEEEQTGMMGGKAMMGKCGMMMKRFSMHAMETAMVATRDGGVVVMVGNKLLKYDRELNLKKEVEIAFKSSEMQKMMMQMQGGCPMMGGAEEKEKAKESTESNESSGHKAHH